MWGCRSVVRFAASWEIAAMYVESRATEGVENRFAAVVKNRAAAVVENRASELVENRASEQVENPGLLLLRLSHK